MIGKAFAFLRCLLVAPAKVGGDCCCRGEEKRLGPWLQVLDTVSASTLLDPNEVVEVKRLLSDANEESLRVPSKAGTWKLSVGTAESRHNQTHSSVVDCLILIVKDGTATYISHCGSRCI